LVLEANNQSNKVLKKITLGLAWISHYLQNNCYFFPYNDTTLNNGEQFVHIWPFWWWPTLPCQQARSPTTDFA